MTTDTTTARKQAVAIVFRDVEMERTQLQPRATEDNSAGLVAKRDLGRYYDVLARELKLAAATLTRGEKLALCDLSNGTLWDSTSIGFLWAEVADTSPAQLAQWKINQAALVEKLRALTPTQTLALVDALERWWLLDNVTDHDESLAAVGLA